MKTAYIIFRDTKPQNNNEVLHLIIHFCRERELDYRLYPESGSSLINIDGKDYRIDLQEKREESGSAYWMICCVLKKQSHLYKNIA